MLPRHLPEPTLYLPGAGEPSLRWGILGPGWIAGEFTSALAKHTSQKVTAAGSRSVERARAFAEAHRIEHAVGSTEELVEHPEVDVVYVATPPRQHLEAGLAAIAAGKHVLIEKPFTATSHDAEILSTAARDAGVLAMEAMWSRYLPQASVLRSLVADGALGQIRIVQADHGQALNPGPNDRHMRPELGGGALLDLGIYPVQFSSELLGAPTAVHAVGALTASGVDAHASLVLTHEGGAQSMLYTSMFERTPVTAAVSGTEGFISFDSPFYNPSSFTLQAAAHGGPIVHWSDPTPLRGFDALSWEATALARFVSEGRTESPVHGLDETVSILRTIDTARAQLEAA